MQVTKWMSRILVGSATAALLALAVVAYGGTSDYPGNHGAPAALAPGEGVEQGAAPDTAGQIEATEAPSPGEPGAAGQEYSCDTCAASQTSSRKQGQVRAQSRRAVVGIGGSAGKGGGSPAELFGEVQRAQPEDTTFRDYSRLPFIATAVDPVSTFSLDVDRTSYLLALTWAKNHYNVEPNSVRAEEWVNAFDYDYPLPNDSGAYGITTAAARHPLEANLHLVRIAFQAPQLPDDTPLNVTLVLDASGSMASGNRVAIAREAAETIRQSLSERDRIAVVHFTTRVIDTYTVEHTTPDDEEVVSSIARLNAHDTTNVQAGLNLGVRLADAARRERPDAFNYIILMSDGVANVDVTDPFRILGSSPETDSLNPLRLITIGVGLGNYNDYLLEQLAQHGNGWYRYLNDTEQARETFSRENWLALSTPFADQTRAQVTWDPGVVKAWRILGYENRVTPDHTFEEARKEFAEIYSTAATTVFYEVELHEDDGPMKGSDTPVTLGSVEVRWVDPSSGEGRSQQADIAGRVDSRFGTLDDSLFRLGAIVALTADRYSALSAEHGNAEPDAASVHGDLSKLREELRLLRLELSGTEAYRDFRFLLGELTDFAAERAASAGSSP
ncbi:MAG: von Willebrand factor type A domain-containing protein [Chloroflexi bacterium]|nr:von Willebrand factor type A domain-containing protein [Chloroflexota bacterium]